MLRIKRFQEGGPMPAEAGAEPQMAPQEAAPQGPQGGGEDPLMQLANIFAQGLQNQDCNLLAQGAEAFLQLIQQSMGGEPGAPAGEPQFKKGGKMVGRKCKQNGGLMPKKKCSGGKVK